MGMMLKPVGLDFGAIMLVGAGAGVNLRLLSAVLPDVEIAVISPADDDPTDDCLEDDA